MKTIKKNSFLPFWIFIVTCSVHTSNTASEKKTSKIGRTIHSTTGWTFLAGEIILGNMSIQQLLLPQSHEPFPFTDLPTDEQSIIIGLLSTGTNASSLNIAARSINALAQTNKNLNALINDPLFFQRMVPNLSKRFNCSDLMTCKALQTQKAKHQLRLQEKLFALCTTTEVSRSAFESLFDQGVDLEFSYDYKNQEVIPLMIASLNNNSMIHFLIEKGVNINKANKMGLTTLMFLVKTNEWWNTHLLIQKPWEALTLLLNNPNLIIDQQDLDGNTALMYAISNRTSPVAIDTIKLLLNAGADPLIANNNKTTPLQAALQTGDQVMIDLVQNTIQRKR